MIFLFARLWDAVIDPAIGTLSDNTRSQWGRRRPWIVAGALIFALGAVPVFLPPPWFGPAALGIALFVLYLGYSMIATPFAAWCGELSSLYHERTRITTYSQALVAVALLLALVLPSVLAQHLAGQPRLELAAMGAMVFVLLALTLPLGISALPETPAGPRPLERPGLKATLAVILSEKLLLRVLLSNGAVRLGQECAPRSSSSS
jgi:Na+/melibiose symporter-like transporter